MAKRGGIRKGAGRKKATHTIAAEKAREYVINRVAAELEPIMTAQIQSAKGLYYEGEVEGEKVIIYKQKPDINAGKNLLDQTIGKAKETVAHEGEVSLKIDV